MRDNHPGVNGASDFVFRALLVGEAANTSAASGRPPAVTSARAGTIPGTRRLVFESPEDESGLVHRARGRAGERIAGPSGVFEFGGLLAEVEKEAS